MEFGAIQLRIVHLCDCALGVVGVLVEDIGDAAVYVDYVCQRGAAERRGHGDAQVGFMGMRTSLTTPYLAKISRTWSWPTFRVKDSTTIWSSGAGQQARAQRLEL